MTSRDVGDRINVQYLAYKAGIPTTADMTLTVTAPDGTTTQPSATFTDPNQYDASFKLTSAGPWRWRWDASGTIDDRQDGTVDAGDPAPPAYASLADLKVSMAVIVNDRDDRLTKALLSASRSIDKACGGRRFWLDAVATARVFNPRDRIVRTDDGEKLLIDDIGSESGLIVEVGSGDSWSPLTDYETGPDNALVRGDPITSLLRTFNTWQPSRTQRVRVTAQWGFPSIPDDIAEAALLLANRLYKRKDSPEGVLGSAEWGVVRVSRIDPDVMQLIEPYQLPGIG